jgi:hypothetical protein
MINLTCKKCSQLLAVPEGGQFRCPKCQAVVTALVATLPNGPVRTGQTPLPVKTPTSGRRHNWLAGMTPRWQVGIAVATAFALGLLCMAVLK